MIENTNTFRKIVLFSVLFIIFSTTVMAQTENLFRKPEGAITRWASFENPGAEKGKGGITNQGAKGNAFQPLEAGESKTLLDVKGSGMITRMWFTVNDHTTTTLRSLKLDIFWDKAPTPAVSVPFGDFFCALLEKRIPFETALLANPEGKSFNCFIPMPFRKAARLVITNESKEKLRLLFYDIDFVLGVKHSPDVLYFHAIWRREIPTKLQRDFEILPRIKGSGRFLGTNIGVILNPDYGDTWWGEGEIKMYIDGDKKLPTIVGTGTEDYIGTGWGQGKFNHMYQGCLISNKEQGRYLFYRYHIPDPVYFNEDIRVTLQQMGGGSKKQVLALQKKGIPLVPVSVSTANQGFFRLLDEEDFTNLENHKTPLGGWTNFYREDDVCAAAFFYLDKPENGLPPLAPVEKRISSLY